MNNQYKHINPFPGLREFNEDEGHLFFGREKQIDELLKKLRTSRFIAVLGESGTGKSSLIKAGIIPSLYSGFMTDKSAEWRVFHIRPGSDPIKNLTDVLNSPDLMYERSADPEILKSITETTLQKSDQGIVESLKQTNLKEKENFLLIVDQFEELFSCKEQEDGEVSCRSSAIFVNLLLNAISQKTFPVYIIITLRSDMLGKCSEFQGLPEAINQAQYLMPNLLREENKRAISGPLAVSQIKITRRLENQLLDNLTNTKDQLPLLQFTLKRACELWRKNNRDNTPLDIEHYKEIGGMEDAINQYAESIYTRIEDMKSLRIADTVFTMVTEQNEEQNNVRRPTKLKELAKIADASSEQVIEVINKFREPGFELIHPPANIPLTEDTVIDICHESLMRQWRRFSILIEEEQESAKLYKRLAESARLYQQGKSELWKDPDLMLARSWYLGNKPNAEWAKRYDPSFERAITFLKASEDQKHNEIQKQNKAHYNRLRKFRILSLAMTVLAVIAIGFAVYTNSNLNKNRQELARLQKKYNTISQSTDVKNLRNQAEFYITKSQEYQNIDEKLNYINKALYFGKTAYNKDPKKLKTLLINIYVLKTKSLFQAHNFKKTIASAGQGLNYFPEDTSLKSYQLIAYTLNNQFNQAKTNFENFMTNIEEPDSFKNVLLKKIEATRENGFKHPHLQRFHKFVLNYEI